MKILITGGGTGGHLAIARALKESALKAKHECIYIGSNSGQDRKWFEKDSDFKKKYFLNTTGVVNKKGFKKLVALLHVTKALFKVLKIIKREKIDVLISVGGFSAAPASFAAKLLNIPLYIHEQNAIEGRLNRLLKPYAKAFFSSYDKDSPIKDYPVAERFFQKAKVRSKIENIIFLGGSQGARFINDLALELAPVLINRGIKIIHQCGEADLERVKKEYIEMDIDIEIYGFTSNMADLLQRSDLAVARAGASTLWELCAIGIPAFFIPYPYAAGDHQYHNGEFLRKKNLAWCERQNENISQSIINILDDDISDKSKKIQKLISQDGADKILAYIQEQKC